MDAAELCVAGFRGEEEAHEARRVPGGDGGGRAVAALEAVIEPHYPKSRSAGRPAAVSACRHAAHLLPAAVVQPVRSGCGGSALRHPVDARVLPAWNSAATRSPTRRRSSTSAICSSRTTLTKAIFAAVAEHLEANGAMLRGGTIVDATLIAASPSTKNAAGSAIPRCVLEEGQPVVFRHEGAHRRRCGERACAHGGRDDGQGARRQGDGPSDPRGRPRGLRRQGLRERREEARCRRRWRAVGGEGEGEAGPQADRRQRARNRRFGKVRAKVEHVFRVMKCQFGYRKVRYRGIAKNGAQVFSLLALANLYLARRPTCVRMRKKGAKELRASPSQRPLCQEMLRPEPSTPISRR